jgi:O-antigen/teichoic acid export membrane protein
VGVRAATLPVTALTTLAMTHTVVGAVGVPGYAMFALVTTLPAMLPITDLGACAAIVEAITHDRSAERALVRGTFASAARNLMCAGGLIAAIGVTLALLGVWGEMLGDAAQRGTDLAVAGAAVLFACSMPLVLGRSVLMAVNRNQTAFALQAAGSVLLLVLVVLLAALGAPTATFISAFFFTQCVVGAVGVVLAGRFLRMPLLRIIFRGVRGRESKDTTPIGHLAVPMTVVTAAMAVAYATDRIVLSHTADATAVAGYSAGAQFFAPASSLLSAAGLPLWVLFAHRRASAGSHRRELVRLTVYFGAGGLVMGAVLIAVGPVAGSWMMHEHIHVSAGLMAAFAALLLVQALGYPANMWLTDAGGLRFQATTFSLMAVVNLAVSIPLARFGAQGPVVGSVASYTALVLVPTLLKLFGRARPNAR